MSNVVVPEDEAGFTALVVEHQRLVYGLARRSLCGQPEAEDVAQEVFMSLFQHRTSIASERHLVFWLRQATARKCIDHRRRRRGLMADAAPEIAVAPAAADPGADPWMAERLRRLVAALPMRARLVVILRYQQDLDPEEIAPILGMPLATVKSHLRRSLARLRRQWPRELNHAG